MSGGYPDKDGKTWGQASTVLTEETSQKREEKENQEFVELQGPGMARE